MWTLVLGTLLLALVAGLYLVFNGLEGLWYLWLPKALALLVVGLILTVLLWRQKPE